MNRNLTLEAVNYVGIQSRQPPDSQRFPAAHAGWFLKRERLSRGLALNKVAAQLKIRERYLWAIEEGVDAEFPQPSNFFTIVTAYAEYLEFDPNPLIDHYREIMPAMIEAQERGPGNVIALWPAMRARARPIALATVALLIAVTGLGFWFSSGSISSTTSKITTVRAPDDLNFLKKRDWAKQQGDNSIATSSIPSGTLKTLGQGSVRIRTMDLSRVLNSNHKVAPPLSKTDVGAQLDTAVTNN